MIYVINHKDEDLKLVSGYKELKVGDAFKDTNTDNINQYNKYLAETTGIYWLWKNCKDDIIGVCHYRRFLHDYNGKLLDLYDIDKLLDEFDIITENIISINRNNYLFNNDIITYNELQAKRKTMYTLYQYLEYQLTLGYKYQTRKELFDKYMDMIESYDDDFIYYLKTSTVFAPHNIFIAKRDIFNNYCESLFKILLPVIEEYSKDPDNYVYTESNECRFIGFIAERFLSYFIDSNHLSDIRFQS